MRKVIRQTKSGAYLSRGNWVEDWRLAQDFKDYAYACDYVRAHHLENVELHCIYGDEPSAKCDWAVPLA
jgi:hypothetical protein